MTDHHDQRRQASDGEGLGHVGLSSLDGETTVNHRVPVDVPPGSDAKPNVGRRGALVESRRPLFPFGFARRHGVMLLEADGQLFPLLREGASPAGLQELSRVMQRHAGPARQHAGRSTASGGRKRIATPETYSPADFDALLGRLHGQDDRSQEWAEALDDQIDLAHVAESLGEPQDLLDAEDDAPIIRLINALLTEAVREGASDIHVESFESRLAIRLRVDGVLREVLTPPIALAPLIVSRIKVMAKLDIAEKRLPQDGRISLRIAGRAVDVRVSTLPSGHGERVVMRLLDKQAGRLELAEIGMPPAVLASFYETLARPHGIVLVTGPTGSGKTTTLYAALAHLNDRSRNILTVEDPIEYFLDGIGQTQVNSRIDMSFARGLRAILRQDPDVVMVGEIRDLETVQIAIQASLTGHLVFSTLHTNSAVGAVTRLRDMGVEPFLLSSTMNGVLAQRLVRVLCSECKSPHPSDATERRLLGLDSTGPRAPTLYRPVGCPACNGLGYRGRMGIYEWIPFDETLRTLVHDQAGEQEITAAARRHSESLRADAVRRVLDGSTSLEEMLRVTRDDE